MTRGTLRVGRLVLAWGLALVMGLGFACTGTAAKDAPLTTKDELKAALGTPGLVIIDVRSAQDWGKSGKKIKGAVREEPKSLDWAKKYGKDQDIVVYCA